MKVKYFIQDADGAPIRWEHVATDRKMPVIIVAVEYVSTEQPGEYELHIHLRSSVPKPTQGSTW
jgi:hypothetical protein